MSDLVNLRRFRKRVEREKAERQAEEKRVRHGRTKAERELALKTNRKLQDKLDQHRIGEEDR